MLLSRNHFLNLIHNISEYGGRGMPVETFVTIILELLDTPEKVSSMFPLIMYKLIGEMNMRENRRQGCIHLLRQCFFNFFECHFLNGPLLSNFLYEEFFS